MNTSKAILYKIFSGICVFLLIATLIFSPMLSALAEGEEGVVSPSPSASNIGEDLPSPTPSEPIEDLPSPSPSMEVLPSPSPSIEEGGRDTITPRGPLVGATPFGAAVATALGNPTVNTGLTDQELVNTLLGKALQFLTLKSLVYAIKLALFQARKSCLALIMA